MFRVFGVTVHKSFSPTKPFGLEVLNEQQQRMTKMERFWRILIVLQAILGRTNLIVVGRTTSPAVSPLIVVLAGGASSSTKPFQSFVSSNQPRTITFPYNTDKNDVQYEHRTLTDFSTRDSRTGFMRKVYSIFAAQMVCTIGVTAIIMNNNELRYFLYQNVKPFLVLSYLLSFGVVSALVTRPELRYKAPMNYILLGIHTLLQSIMVGTFSSAVGPHLVCFGTIHSLVAFLAITVYSFQPNPKYDLTPLGNLLLTSMTSLTVGSLLNYFFKLPLMDNLISGAMAVLSATYLAYDTQKIVGGKHHKHSYSSKEYILAALNLYQDIISLFMHIVSVLQKMEQSKQRRTQHQSRNHYSY